MATIKLKPVRLKLSRSALKGVKSKIKGDKFFRLRGQRGAFLLARGEKSKKDFLFTDDQVMIASEEE